MNKQDVAKSLEEYSGKPFVTKQQVANFLGYRNTRSVEPILYGLEKVGNRYYSKDVAEAITMRGRR